MDMSDLPVAEAGESSQTGTRTSSRARNKSQRVLEIEDTKRYIRSQAQATVAVVLGEEIPPSTFKAGTGAGAKKGKAKPRGKGKGKGKGKEVYCLCKTDTDGPMIECGGCNDWFHFTCIDLSEDEAEKIHKYICPGCHERSGQTTTHTYDIETFPSPSPPIKSKSSTPTTTPTPKRKIGRSSPHSDEGSGSGSDDGSSEAKVSSSASDSGSEEEHEIEPVKPAKRPRLPPRASISRPTAGPKASPTTTTTRKPSITVPGELPPMRKYVREKLAPAFRALFGENQMSIDRSMEYAIEVEVAIYNGFKEVVGGKETTGNKYKTQFNLLSSSLNKGLRPELALSIVKGHLFPGQVALLTSSDLASEEQLLAMERAKQAVLEQTVKARNKDDAATIRLGRDGFEKVEDVHEKELKALARQEEAARFAIEEKKKMDLEQLVDPLSTAISTVPSPVVQQTQKQKRSVSIDVPPSPVTQSTFAMTSAWGGGSEADVSEPIFGNSHSHQGAFELDLSDIVNDPDQLQVDLLEDAASAGAGGPSEMEIFESKPVAWSGGITNPANPSPHTPPINLRQICRLPSPNYTFLLPHKTVEITGRVPTKNSLQFLSDSRLSPGKELITVALTVDPLASEEQVKAWEQMTEYHIGRDRHAIYLPYGNRPPSGAAKELYLIPLRPTDPSPEFTDLIDGYSLPGPGQRKQSLFLGVFVANKVATVIAPAPVPPVPSILPGSSVSATATPLQNEQLQALMASLNPTALQGLLGSTPNQPIQGTTPFPIAAGSITPLSYPPLPVGYLPSSNQGYQGYPPAPAPASGGSYSPHTQIPNTSREWGSHTPPHQHQYQYPPAGRERPDRGERRESDNGWGSRGRGRGHGRGY